MQPVILLIFISIPALSIVWAVWADRRLRTLEAAAPVRLASLLTMIVLMGGFSWIILARMEHLPKVPGLIYSLVLVWGLIALPLLALPMMTGWSILKVFRALSSIGKKPVPEEMPVDEGRRRFIGSAAVAVPALATFGAAGVGFTQRNHFRIREITVPIRDLPGDLHGLRIAHLSDTHVGKFTHGKLLHDLAEATNRLKADLVLLTGDLIDQSLTDLPEALDMMARLDPRSGLYLIEGNHDLFQGPELFAKGVLDRGFNLLRNETAVLDVKGHPIELLGIRWTRGSHDPLVDGTAARRKAADALPILLAHHPHAFDRAAELGIPLTLAGHTHGGQLMITPEIGPGPMMFRYWSGLYQKNHSALVVSNGSGNWFPVRTAAPAEILDIRLVRA